MNNSSFNWKVAGYAGEGIMTVGLIMSKTCARHGLKIFDYTEYPSLIRGGHNTYQIYASTTSAYCQKKSIDLLIALNKNGVSFHLPELHKNSLVVYDGQDDQINIEEFELPCKSFDLPMVKLARDMGAERVMANNVALGASVFLLGLDFSVFSSVVRDIFSDKGPKVIELNLKAAQAGYDFTKNNLSKPIFHLPKTTAENNITATGNEAVGLGSIAGGLQCYIAYPMTPSSSVLHFLASKAKDHNFLVKHAEDEISVVNMALGSSFAGVRSMVGTSGGGFCYMTEALGLSGIAELPLVVFEAMRPGPALGMPTWHAQGDLLFAVNASHDEFPRFVLAPGDGQEAFELSKKALELAEKYQTLVILLSDKYLAESRHTIVIKENNFRNTRHNIDFKPKVDSNNFYQRYKLTDDGISLRSFPGSSGGQYIANSYEHDVYGFATEVAEIRTQQMEKRFKKLEKMRSEIPQQYFLTDNNAKLLIISFGSNKGPLTRAREILLENGISIDFLNLSWIWPFPNEQVKTEIENHSDAAIVENNSQGQLAKLISQELGIKIDKSIRKYDGRPFYAEDIANEIMNKFI